MGLALPLEEKIDYDLKDNEVEDYAIARDDQDYKISFIKKKDEPLTNPKNRITGIHTFDTNPEMPMPVIQEEQKQEEELKFP